ncbi:hypothetical protein HWV62_33873 [Athelia sp. TMB]|nr:hypothetical protein HWV62_33873 [Athelia sp. TMB]
MGDNFDTQRTKLSSKVMNGANKDVLDHILATSGCDLAGRYVERYTQFQILAQVCRTWRDMIVQQGRILQKLVLDMRPPTIYRQTERPKQGTQMPVLDRRDNINVHVDAEEDPRETIIIGWRAVREQLEYTYPGFNMLPPSRRTEEWKSRQIDLIVNVGSVDHKSSCHTYAAVAGKVQKLTVQSTEGVDTCVQWLRRQIHIPHPALRTVIIAPEQSDEPDMIPTTEQGHTIQRDPIVTGANMLSTLYLQGGSYDRIHFATLRFLSVVILRDCTMSSYTEYQALKSAFHESSIEYADLTFVRFDNNAGYLGQEPLAIHMPRLKNMVLTHIPSGFAILFLNCFDATSLHRIKLSLACIEPYTDARSYDAQTDRDIPKVPDTSIHSPSTLSAINALDLQFCRPGAWAPACTCSELSKKIDGVVKTLAEYLPNVRELQWMGGMRYMQGIIIRNAGIWNRMENLWMWDIIDGWSDNHCWTPELDPDEEHDEEEIITASNQRSWFSIGQRLVPTHIESIMRLRRCQGHPLRSVVTLERMWHGEQPQLAAHALQATSLTQHLPSYTYRGIPGDHSDRMEGCYWPGAGRFGCSTHWGYEMEDWVEIREWQ